MSVASDTVRQQIKATQSQLSAKLQSLENQVSNTVNSTGNAVNATVGAVQNAVESVSNTFDIRRHFDNHPWLVLGGAVALGYLAVELLTGSSKNPESASETNHSPCQLEDCKSHSNESLGSGDSAIETMSQDAPAAFAYESGCKGSNWRQLRSIATSALIGIVQDLAKRAVPHAMNYLAGNPVVGKTVRAAPDPLSTVSSSIGSNHE